MRMDNWSDPRICQMMTAATLSRIRKPWLRKRLRAAADCEQSAGPCDSRRVGSVLKGGTFAHRKRRSLGLSGHCCPDRTLTDVP